MFSRQLIIVVLGYVVMINQLQVLPIWKVNF